MNKITELYHRHKEIVNYLIVGCLTTVVSLGVYYGLVLTVLDPDNAIQLQIANVASWVAGVTFAYFTNRKYVFESKNPNMLREAGSFVAARVGTLIMDMVFMFLTVSMFGMNDKVAKLLDQVLITVANYLLSKLFVFRGNGSNDKEKNK